MGVHHPRTAGAVLFEGRDIATIGRAELRRLQRDIQIILQDPFESLNQRHTVGKILHGRWLTTEPSGLVCQWILHGY